MLRSILAVSLVLSALSSSAMAEPISTDRLEAYIEGIDAVSADFTQINQDGSIDTGSLLIDRPGRMRFDYDAPNESLVLASGGSLAIFDAKSNGKPERYPLSKTPLGIILNRDVSLTQSRLIAGQGFSSGITEITARDPKRPEAGAMKLSFSGNPIALRSWVIVNELGEATTVILDDLKPVSGISSRTFLIRSEMSKRGIED